MNPPLLTIVLSLAALPPGVLTQDPVRIQFQTDPVLVQSGTDIVFTVLTVPEVLSIVWNYPGGETPLGLWAAGSAVVNSVPQYQGRVTITATQLRIASAQLRDAGNYTVEVDPLATTGLASNSRSVQLRVFEAVAGVSLAVPSVALENGNVSMSCTWTAGTQTSVQWGKGGSALSSDSRVVISRGSLVIHPARRGDAGDYTCTVSNPVSARTAMQSLTVYYGPDTPELTKSTPAECVGRGDAVVGQTIRLTCVSDSLPPATFSWTHDGQPVASGQPGSGVLSVQTFSTNESGRYTCVASNAITRDTSKQDTDLAVVGVCLSGGAVAGIVIACLVALILIIVAIILLVRWRNVDQRLRRLSKADPQPRLIDPDPHLARGLDLDQQPNPPLHNMNTNQHNNLYTLPLDGLRNVQTLPQNGPRHTDTLQHDGHLQHNGRPHIPPQNAHSYPHNGVMHNHDAFTRAPPPAYTLPNSQRHNPNILIQAGSAHGGGQPQTVHVSLNTLPQQNGGAQLPTVHVNLNSYPPNGQSNGQPNGQPNQPPWEAQQPRSQQGNAMQSANAVNSQSAIPHHNDPRDAIPAEPTNPRMQSGVPYHGGSPRSGRSRVNASPQALIPTGYTHAGSHAHAVQRNADTQTDRRYPSSNGRSRRADPADANSAPGGSTQGSGSHPRQMPWDQMRGTPSYPNGRATRERSPSSSPSTSPSDSTDYTSRPSAPQPSDHQRRNRQPPGAHTQTAPRRETDPGRDSAPRQRRSLPSSQGTRRRVRDGGSVTPPEEAEGRGGTGYAQRTITRQDGDRASHQSQAPQAPLPPSAQQQSARRSDAPQGPAWSQRPAPPQGPGVSDSRTRADPNHLPQAGVAVWPVAPAVPQNTQGRRAMADASDDPSSLTQAALQTHTLTTHNPFHDRNHQTQAALLHPGPQPRAANPGPQKPPPPPPVIPLTQFQTIPRERNQDSSPTRMMFHPLRPPVNVPMAQRHPQTHHRLAGGHVHANPHHRHPGNAHMHGNPHHRHPGNAGPHRPAHAHRHHHPGQPHQGHRARPTR